MVERKRRAPAPAFRQPSPFNPITGGFAPIGMEGIVTRLALFQVVGDDDTEGNADTHDNYVLCRGFDPQDGKFYLRIAVAKPYDIRGTNPYVLAQILVCSKVRSRLGDNAGVAATSTGHPADLDEEIELLYDDDDVSVEWLDISGGGGGATQYRWGKLDGALAAGATATVSLWQTTGGGWEGWDEPSTVNQEDVYAPPTLSAGTIASDQWVLIAKVNGRWIVLDWQVATQVVQTTYQYDTATNKFQKKTRELLVAVNGAESAWTDVYTATTQTVQTTYQIDGANAEFEKKTIELTTLEKGTESGWSVVHTGDVC